MLPDSSPDSLGDIPFLRPATNCASLTGEEFYQIDAIAVEIDT